MKDKKDKPTDYTGDIVQNQFTAYVEVALKNNRITYFHKQQDIEKHMTYYASEDEISEAVHTEDTSDFLTFPGLRNEELTNAIGQLSEKDLILIRLRVLYGYSFKKISVILGIPSDTASKRYRRAIAKLRKELEEHK